VCDVLDRLGDPATIVRAEVGDPLVPQPPSRSGWGSRAATFARRIPRRERAALLMLTLGSGVLVVGWLVGAFIVLAVYQLYLNQMLEIRWRRWLTDRYLRAWLTDRAYYRMQLVARESDNPDQRIAEDVQLLISHTLALFIGGLRAFVTLVTFVAILWTLSGTLTFPLGGHTLVLPGYMVWVSILYAVGGTWLTDWIGRPLVQLNFDKQRYEADFRFSLVRFRENTEGVALYRGERDELHGFGGLFEAVVRNWWGIMRRQKRLTTFTSGYSQGAWIVPSVVAAPRYFNGELGPDYSGDGWLQCLGILDTANVDDLPAQGWGALCIDNSYKKLRLVCGADATWRSARARCACFSSSCCC